MKKKEKLNIYCDTEIMVVNDPKKADIIVVKNGEEIFVQKKDQNGDIQESTQIFCNNEYNREIAVTMMLIKIGIKADGKGYDFIRSSILMIMSDPNLKNKFGKKISPELCKTYNSTQDRIQRDIGYAIEGAFNNGNIELLNEIFPNYINNRKAIAKNSEFLFGIADILTLNEKELIK